MTRAVLLITLALGLLVAPLAPEAPPRATPAREVAFRQPVSIENRRARERRIP
jgi:hypothetical protein